MQGALMMKFLEYMMAERGAGDTPMIGDQSLSGAKGVDKLEKARRMFQKDPGARWRAMIGKVKDLLQASGTHGMEAYGERYTEVKFNRLLAHMWQLMVHVAEAAEEGNQPKVLGIVAGGFMFMEQYQLDGGKTDLAWLLTLLPDPPQLGDPDKKPRRQMGGRSRFTKLAEDQITAAAVGALSDWDKMDQVRTKLL